MFLRRTYFFYSVFCTLAVMLTGCSNSSGRFGVTGDVTLAGQPLKSGIITFVPLDGQDTYGGATITNGTYDVPQAQGLKAGNYMVQLTSGDGKTPANEEEAAAPGITNIVSFDLIPEAYGINSTQKFEVKSSGSNKFDVAVPNVNTRKKKR
jgi:hypothetical protein